MSTLEDMADQLINLQAIIRTLDKEAENIGDTEITALCRKYVQIKEFREGLEAATEKLTTLYRKMQSEDLPNAFERLEQESVTIDGQVFSPSAKIHFSIPEAKEDVAYRWLTDNGYSALIKAKVNPKTLTSALTDHFTTTAQMPPQDVIPSFTRKTISVRRK